MKKRYLLLFAVFLLAFGALFTLLSTAPVPRGAGFLEISVIARESDSSVWASTKQGMEQAAKDLDVELRLLMLSEPNNVEEQRQLLTREAQGGADALILSPADPGALTEAVSEVGLPLVIIGAELGPYPSISADNQAMGRSIALEMLPRLSPGSRVVLLAVAPGKGAVEERALGAIDALRGADIHAELALVPGSKAAMSEVLALLMEDPPDLIIALEPVALEAAVRASQGVAKGPLLCGIGSTNLIVSYLERGTVKAIAAQNDFAMGYLAIEAAVKAAGNRQAVAGDSIGFSIIRQDTMYLPQNQKLLFPFVR